MPRVSAGRLDALPVGEPVFFNLDGRRVAIVRRGRTVHALDDSCPHAGGPLSQGTVSGGELACPYHGWVFDLATGACRAPARAVSATVYPVSVEDGEVWVDLP
jgi:nitrite reductase/ring-hydroxylating ferredoxin subunit